MPTFSIASAEPADCSACAELLVTQLADDIGEEKLAVQFRDALLHENRHLQDVRQWYQTSVKALQG